MTLADYMVVCLLDPAYGYYATCDPFGAGGDFITSPEISQMFGEMIGLCLAQNWLDQGAPAPFTLAEAGPGRGTLMADILRATRGVPGFHAAARVHLIEASATLRAAQATRVPGAIWLDHVDQLPEQPLLFVANEFFDALPIRQFRRDGGGWREVVVGLQGDQLAFGLTEAAPLAALVHRMDDTRDGDLVELCPALAPITATLGARIARHGGFLERLGITQRAQTLAAALSGPALDAHIAAHRRLTHPTDMGDHFKVIGIYPDSATPPPGLTA